MLYEETYLLEKLEQAKSILDSRKGEMKFGYNDCWQFIVEYDRALRPNSSTLSIAVENYTDPIDWKSKIKSKFESFEKLAVEHGYIIINNKRPRIGDVAYTIMPDGYMSSMIADRGRWVTATGEEGVKSLIQWRFLEPKIPLIVRPVRS